jgi:hypothetical protein
MKASTAAVETTASAAVKTTAAAGMASTAATLREGGNGHAS